MSKIASELRGHTLRASDGDIGKVHDLLFDDEKWVMRHLVVDTGGWLTGRKVLISPVSFGQVDWEARVFHANLTRAQVESSPDVKTEAPLTRRDESLLFDHYGYLPYWSGLALWGLGIYPAAAGPVLGAAELAARHDLASLGIDPLENGPVSQRAPDPHLRSASDTVGYHVHAIDGDLGKVKDFLLDPNTFEIDYVQVDAGSAWHHRTVLLAPHRIQSVDWAERRMGVRLSRSEIQREAELETRLRRDVRA